MTPASTPADMEGSPPVRQFALKLALLSVSLLFSLILVELFLRLIHFAPDELHLFQENPNGTGSYRLRPNLDIVTRFGNAKIPIWTNSHGMRWRELPLAPLTKKRIAFVGDSFTFGLWADTVEDSFVGVFEREVGADEFEALNFGVPGFGFADMELLIREQVLQFRPECIFVISYNGNDFLDTYLGLERYYVDRTGVLLLNRDVLERKIPEQFRKEGFKFGKSLVENIYVMRLVKAGVQSVFRPDKSSRERLAVDRSYSSNLFWSRRDYSKFSVEAKDVSLEMLAKIDALCRRNQVELRIVTVPFVEQIYSPAAFGDDYLSDLPQRYLQEFADTNSIPFLDLLPGLREYARKEKLDLYYRADGHLNNEGHRVIGALLASSFTKRKHASETRSEQR